MLTWQGLPAGHLSLLLLDTKGASAAAQTEVPGGKSRAAIAVDEFVVCLALFGHVKYDSMNLAGRVSAIMDNYLCQKDEVAVVSTAVVGKVARFDVGLGAPLPRQARCPRFKPAL